MKSFILAIAAILAAGSSWADEDVTADYCVSTPLVTLVCKNFTVPKPGRCRSCMGFFKEYPVFSATGSACRSTDGAHVVFNLFGTQLNTPGFAEFYNLDLVMSPLSGNLSYTTLQTSTPAFGPATGRKGSYAVTGATSCVIPLP